MTNKLVVRTPSGIDSLQAIVDALATGVLSIEAAAELFGTTKAAILQLLSNPQVVTQVEARREQLYSQLDVSGRLKRKALWAVESAVPRLAELAHDTEVPPAARVAAIAELVRISGVRDRERADNTVERVVVNIHTGTDTITIEARPTAEGAPEEEKLRDEPPSIDEENDTPELNELQININTPKGNTKSNKVKNQKLRVQL